MLNYYNTMWNVKTKKNERRNTKNWMRKDDNHIIITNREHCERCIYLLIHLWREREVEVVLMNEMNQFQLQ